MDEIDFSFFAPKTYILKSYDFDPGAFVASLPFCSETTDSDICLDLDLVYITDYQVFSGFLVASDTHRATT